MAVTVTERGSDRSMGRDRRGLRTATRGFDVTGVDNEDDAIEQVPERNDLHPQASGRPLKVISHKARRLATSLYRVRVQYAEPENSSSHPDDYDDPVLAPPRLVYNDINREVRVDVDKDGNPITNSARDAYRDWPTDYITEYQLEVRVNEPFFDPVLAKQLRLSVNETALIINGVQIAAPLEARLMRMRPDGEHELNTDYVTVVYEWAIRDADDAPTGVSPHAIRVKDHGFRAAGDASGTTYVAQLYDRNEPGKPSDPVVEEVPLDGQGGPLNSYYAIGPDDMTAANLGAPDGATVESTTFAKFLWYNPPRLRVRDHVGQLGL